MSDESLTAARRKRQGAGKRTLLAVVLVGSLLSGALSGCGIVTPGTEQTEEATVDYGDVADAVTAAVPRVVNVRDLSRSLNGFGHALRFGLVTDSAEPFTADELDAVVEAVWDSLPWEPNAITITAGAQDDEIVDLRAAAAELEPLSVTQAGQAGVTLTGMWDRYGKWTKPE